MHTRTQICHNSHILYMYEEERQRHKYMGSWSGFLGPGLGSRGCELRFATILREPISHAMSRVRNEFATESVHDRFNQFSSQMSN